MLSYQIIEINDSNISSLQTLLEKTPEEEKRILAKTFDRWKDGSNNFSKNGEKLWGVFVGEGCVATGGLSIDPYLPVIDPRVGRVRSIYVDPQFRKQGISKALLRLILERAKKHFQTVRLSTKNPIAAKIYESFGFVFVGDMQDKPTYEIKDLKSYITP